MKLSSLHAIFLAFSSCSMDKANIFAYTLNSFFSNLMSCCYSLPYKLCSSYSGVLSILQYRHFLCPSLFTCCSHCCYPSNSYLARLSSSNHPFLSNLCKNGLPQLTSITTACFQSFSQSDIYFICWFLVYYLTHQVISKIGSLDSSPFSLSPNICFSSNICSDEWLIIWPVVQTRNWKLSKFFSLLLSSNPLNH